MKKTILAFIFGLLFIVGCTKDKKNATSQEKILGTWKGDNSDSQVIFTTSGWDTTVTSSMSISYLKLTFTNDGNGQWDSLGYNQESLAWEILNNNRLILDGQTWDITLLSSSKLNIRTVGVDSSALGVSQYDSKMKFTK